MKQIVLPSELKEQIEGAIVNLAMMKDESQRRFEVEHEHGSVTVTVTTRLGKNYVQVELTDFSEDKLIEIALEGFFDDNGWNWNSSTVLTPSRRRRFKVQPNRR